MSETSISNEALMKALTALGDALSDFSVGVGRAVDILRPELAAEVASDLLPVDHAYQIDSPLAFHAGITDPLTHCARVVKCRPGGCEVCK